MVKNIDRFLERNRVFRFAEKIQEIFALLLPAKCRHRSQPGADPLVLIFPTTRKQDLKMPLNYFTLNYIDILLKPSLFLSTSW